MRLYTGLAWARMGLGLCAEARAAVQEALAIARNESDPDAALCPEMLGQIALGEGEYAEARRLLEECVADYRQSHAMPDLLGWMLVLLGLAVRGLGQASRARECVAEALALGREIHSFHLQIHALAAASLLLADRGSAERAAELYALASRHPFVSQSRWFEDVVGRHIAAAAASLPPAVVAAAQERGRARDLQATVEELAEELS